MFTKKSEPFLQESPAADAYFHTMKDDLKDADRNAGHPAAKAADISETSKNGRVPENIPSSSPFFAETPASLEPSPAPEKKNVPAPQPKQPLAFSAEQISADSPAPKTITNWINIAIAVLTVVIVAVMAAGAYLFWMTRQSSPSMESSAPGQKEPLEEKAPEEKPVNISPELEKYSLENPNIISIDVESATDQEIRDLLSKKASDVSNLQTKEPVEFLITDRNNTPIAFPIFAVASKMDFSQDILSNLEEKFSLYIYPEPFGSRLGLGVNIKNKDVILTKMLAEEKTLSSALELLFLGNQPEPASGTLFKDGKYNELPIRYLNLNADSSLSVDYTVTDKQLLIGTSKDTLRAIMDKISSGDQAPADSEQEKDQASDALTSDPLAVQEAPQDPGI